MEGAGEEVWRGEWGASLGLELMTVAWAETAEKGEGAGELT